MRKDWFFYVLLSWACIFMMTLASNKAKAQPDRNFPVADLWGHVYPTPCRQDLTWLLPTLQVVRKDLGYNPNGSKGIGYWWHDFGTRRTTISLDTTLNASPARYNSALHHELCHELMYRTTGNHSWHKE